MTVANDKFLVGVVQVIDDYGSRFNKLQEIWNAVPRDPTKYYEKMSVNTESSLLFVLLFYMFLQHIYIHTYR